MLLAIPLLVWIASPAVGAASDWTNPAAPGRHPKVTSAFDPPAQRWQAGHRGVDLNAAPGSTIHSAGDGVISFAGWVGDRATLSIRHGSLTTTYEPVTATVLPGEHVSRGQTIGTLGLGGHCSGHCLHWGLKDGDEYLDPLSLLGSVPPILKPMGSGERTIGQRSTRQRQTLQQHPPQQTAALTRADGTPDKQNGSDKEPGLGAGLAALSLLGAAIGAVGIRRALR